MLSATALDAGHTIRLCKKDGRYFAAVDGLAVFGAGDAYETAIAELERRFGELQAFSEKTGLAIGALAPRRVGSGSGWGSSLRRTAMVFVCLALLTIPFSYALSSALERAVEHLKLKGGKAFWGSVEESLIQSAGDGSAPAAEEQARTLAALRIMVQRVRPYVDEIRPIFGCTPPPAKQ